jgi:hypothetical protein
MRLKLIKTCPLLFGSNWRGIFDRSRNVYVASYSRSSSNSPKSPYKVVTAKIKSKFHHPKKNLIAYFFISYGIGIESIFCLADASSNKSVMTFENSANWELFPVAKNNRFFLQEGRTGLAYLSGFESTAGCDLKELVDVENKDKSKLHISLKKCPVLIRKSLAEMFPAPEVVDENVALSLIILTQKSTAIDHEKAAINFLYAARDICQKLRLHGYWSDFLNPFSGKAFFSYHQKSLYKNDARFRGLCMKLEEVKGIGANDNCLLISEETSNKFNGSIFTNLPSMEMFKELVLEED